MSTQPEARVTKRILDKLNALPDTYARKVHGGRYSSGWPDVIGSCGGTLLALEVKHPDATRGATKLQLAELAKWYRTGAVAGVVCSWEETVELLQQSGIPVR